MEKKELDWGNIRFTYMTTDKRYVAEYKDGVWGEGALTFDPNVVTNECVGILQYRQKCFEGLKAYITEDGSIVTFRPDLNAERMMDPAVCLEMPLFLKERFLEVADVAIKASAAWVPPFGSDVTLYLRPCMFASGSVIGARPSDEYQLRLFGTPVGPYFKGDAKPLTLCASDFDRAVPQGTGHVKAGLNYAMNLCASVTAHVAEYDKNVSLDPVTRICVEETGGVSFLSITKDNEVVTPKSDPILPSITRRSLVYVAEYYLGLKVTQRLVKLVEFENLAECGLCGTAVVTSPVGKIVDYGEETYFPSGTDEMGPVIKKLYETFTGIQMGTIEASEGWIKKIVQDVLTHIHSLPEYIDSNHIIDSGRFYLYEK